MFVFQYHPGKVDGGDGKIVNETVRRVFVVQLNYAAAVSVLRPITSRVRAPKI